jgi:hypothetical protein
LNFSTAPRCALAQDNRRRAVSIQKAKKKERIGAANCVSSDGEHELETGAAAGSIAKHARGAVEMRNQTSRPVRMVDLRGTCGSDWNEGVPQGHLTATNPAAAAAIRVLAAQKSSPTRADSGEVQSTVRVATSFLGLGKGLSCQIPGREKKVHGRRQGLGDSLNLSSAQVQPLS